MRVREFLLNSSDMVEGPTSASTITTPKRRGRGGISLLLIVVLLVVIGLFVWAEMQRREAKQRLEQTTAELEEIRKSTQRGGEEVANEVLSKVRAHMIIPDEPKPTVATIVDINKLKEANEFYSVAENGDHLIITEKRAILYDSDRNIILDVVPIRLNQTASPSPASTGAGTSPTATPARTSPAVSPTATPAP